MHLHLALIVIHSSCHQCTNRGGPDKYGKVNAMVQSHRYLDNPFTFTDHKKCCNIVMLRLFDVQYISVRTQNLYAVDVTDRRYFSGQNHKDSRLSSSNHSSYQRLGGCIMWASLYLLNVEQVWKYLVSRWNDYREGHQSKEGKLALSRSAKPEKLWKLESSAL